MHTNIESSDCKFANDTIRGNPVRTGVLIVEDEEFVREAATELLEAHGYNIFKASNFAEALRIFRENGSQIHLLLTDVIIPGQNGYELGKVLRQLSQQLKVLYISGYSQKAVAEKIMLDSNSYFVAKPFSSEKLLTAVRAALALLHSSELA
ncbi:MAG TPA: response regulator [Terriglobales bacterium]|jgi:CheY-like chemotaxis protein